MAARQPAPPSASTVPLILGVAAAIAAALTWFGYPGLILAAPALAFAAISAPPALLTGKRNSAGAPTPASPGEAKAFHRYQMWNELRLRSVVPSGDWLPGWPMRLWWFTALAAGFLAAAIPAPALDAAWRIGAGLSVFAAIVSLNGALRRWTAPDDPCLGPTADVLAGQLRTPAGIAVIASAGIGGAAAFLAVLITLDRLGLAATIAPAQPWMVAAAAAVLVASATLALGVRGAALERWRTMVRIRAEWEPRWQITKLDPAPRLVDHTEIGNIQVDTFDAHPSIGSAAIYPLIIKINAALGSGSRAAILEAPDVDSQNQPIPGTKSGTRFRIATFVGDAMPDVTSADTNPAEAQLRIAAAFSWMSDSNGYGRWIIGDVVPLHEEGNPESTAAWQVEFHAPDGPSPKDMRLGPMGTVGAFAEAEVLIDHRGAGDLFIGALTGDTTAFAHPAAAKTMKELALTDTWNERWTNILKLGAVRPRPEHAVYAEATCGRSTLYRQPFVVQQGLDPLEFFKLEPKIATTLNAAPFVSVTGFAGQGDRPGERHGQAFVVTWSATPVPSNPDKLDPQPGEGPKWVLAGRINAAFDVARLARPEVIAVKPLTAKDSRGGHIWEIRLRLHGGVTLAEVRTAAQRIRQALGSEWLRVGVKNDTVVIVAGVDAKTARNVRFAQPEKTHRDYITSLDWEQAFSDAKVIGQGGMLPTLTRSDVLPNNDQVQVLDFKLPTGTSRALVKEAVSKLSTTTGNSFVDVRESPDGADSVRLLVSRDNPLPDRAGFQWEIIDSAEGIPFATGIEGEPIEFDPINNPHALLAGVTGAGKAQVLSSRVPVPIQGRFPNGWATIGELEVGDLVYAADGSPTAVVALSDIVERPIHRVHFSDGQHVDVSPDHLWKVSSTLTRLAHTSTTRLNAREARRESVTARASRLREVAATYPAGTLAPRSELARISGLGLGLVHRTISDDLGVLTRVPTAKSSRQYDGTDLVRYLAERPKRTINGITRTAEDYRALGIDGRWMTSRTIADTLVGRDATRAERDRIKDLLRGSSVQTRPGTAMQSVRAFPVDEALMLLADHVEQFASTASNGRAAAPIEEIVTTEALLGRLREHRNDFAVRLPEAIDALDDVTLPIPAYTLGVWLGDGTSRSGAFTGIDSEVKDGVEADGYVVTDRPGMVFGILGLRSQLREAGLLQNKHIPAAYLRASKTDRLALLQGLMDTDGTIAKSGACEFCVTSKRLADDTLELVRSLGIKATMTEGPAVITEADPDRPGQKRRRVTGTRYRIKFTTTTPVFRLTRKLERLPAEVRPTATWNYITGIEVLESAPMRCISIAHAEHVYLTEQFIPTHNSVLAQVFLYGALVKGAELYVIDPVKGGADFQFAKEHAKAMASTPAEAQAVMKAVYAEVVRRKNMNAAAGVGSFMDLPNPPPRIFVMIDEFTSLMGQDQVPPSSDDPAAELEREAIIADNRAKTDVGVFAGKIAREARSAGVHLLLGTQKLSAKMLDSIPSAADLKTNLARVLLGKTSSGDRMSALRAFQDAPELTGDIPKGRGLYEPLTSSAVAAQVWFAPQADLREQLLARRAPLAVEDRLDVAALLPKRPDETAGAIRHFSSAPSAVEVPVEVEPEEVELDALELVLDFDDEDGDDVDSSSEIETTIAADVEVDINTNVEMIVEEKSKLMDKLMIVDGSWAAPAGALHLPTSDPGVVGDSGWWKLDWALTALGDATAVEWCGPDLLDEDEIGVQHFELVEDALSAAGVEVTFRHEPPVVDEVAAPAPVAAVELAPAPAPAPLLAAPAPALPVAPTPADESAPAAPAVAVTVAHAAIAEQFGGDQPRVVALRDEFPDAAPAQRPGTVFDNLF